MSRVGLDTYKHVLPRAKAWNLTIDKRLRQYFVGLSDEPGRIQDYQDGVWADFLPFETTKLAEWEAQFGFLPDGLSELERRQRLDAAWKALGGQSPRYLQDTVQAAGFDLYIHEWWFPEGLPDAIARRPLFYLDDGSVPDLILPDALLGDPDVLLGNEVLMGAQTNYGPTRITYMLGEPPALLGNGVLMGARHQLGELIDDNLTDDTISDDPDDYPYFLYWGAQTFPGSATVPAEREAELKTLLLKLCPAQQRIGLLVNFV